MNAARQYRAKSWECLSLAESMNDPERRAEMLRFAKMWLSLAEPMGEIPGAANRMNSSPCHRERIDRIGSGRGYLLTYHRPSFAGRRRRNV